MTERTIKVIEFDGGEIRIDRNYITLHTPCWGQLVPNVAGFNKAYAIDIAHALIRCVSDD